MIWLLLSTAFGADLLAMAKPADSAEWGYIDTSGAFVVPAQYRKCFPYSDDGYAHYYDKKRKSFFFIDPKGKELSVAVDGRWELRNIVGFGTIGFDEGRAPYGVDGKWGYLDTSGKPVIPAEYDKVTRFFGGHAIAQHDDMFFVLDLAGKKTEVKVAATAVKRFSEGLAPFKGANGKMGYLKPDGTVGIKPQFKSVGYFVDGMAWAKTAEGTVGFIDTSGSWAITPQFAAAKDFGAGSGLAKVKEGETWKFVKTNGKVVTLSDADSFKSFSEGLAVGKKGEMVGFFDTTGAWVIKPQFENVRKFKNGYAAARKGDKWGVIDKKGAWVVKPVLDGVRDFEKTE